MRFKEYMDSYDSIQPDDHADPYNTIKHAHESTLVELKQEMLDAISNRKQAVLPTAIKIFNKLQDKYVSQTTLHDYDSKVKEIDESTGF